jgi:UTP--glucose-1-phosphate uridylyltransferase
VIMDSAVPATKSLIDIYDETGDGAITVQEVEAAELQFYGVIEAHAAKMARWGERLLQVTDLVEKPKTGTAPSNLGVSGRYVLPPEIFDYLETTKPGAGGEIQLTDGLCALAKNGALWAHIHEGKVHDAGDKLGFLKATVEYALRNPSFGAKFRSYLKDLKL